ncbi:MAG TPA: hypothetical protein VHS27_07580 [Gaiellales bacterium]|nr:hypothetical protein [Gaiellales bacterium]
MSVDLTEGIVNRFRTMAISRGALLTGHVVGSLIRCWRASAPRTGRPNGRPRPGC